MEEDFFDDGDGDFEEYDLKMEPVKRIDDLVIDNNVFHICIDEGQVRYYLAQVVAKLPVGNIPIRTYQKNAFNPTAKKQPSKVLIEYVEPYKYNGVRHSAPFYELALLTPANKKAYDIFVKKSCPQFTFVVHLTEEMKKMLIKDREVIECRQCHKIPARPNIAFFLGSFLKNLESDSEENHYNRYKHACTVIQEYFNSNIKSLLYPEEKDQYFQVINNKNRKPSDYYTLYHLVRLISKLKTFVMLDNFDSTSLEFLHSVLVKLMMYMDLLHSKKMLIDF